MSSRDWVTVDGDGLVGVKVWVESRHTSHDMMVVARLGLDASPRALSLGFLPWNRGFQGFHLGIIELRSRPTG